MKQIVNMEIPLGYRIVDKKENVKAWDAERILVTRKQRCYTKAIRRGTDVELVGSYIVCPFCGKEFVSNTKYSVCGYKKDQMYERISNATIHDWSSLQLSLFEENEEKTLYISSPISTPFSFKCPECDNVSKKSDKVKRVKLILERKEVSIRSEITSLSEILEADWITKDSVSVTFPVYEVLTFNLNKGRIYIKLENDKGYIFCQRDVTPQPELLCASVAQKLIMNNKMVNRNIKRLFEKAWGCELPYCGKEIEMKNLFKMTMFVGYPKDFYSAVPYKMDSLLVDKSFGNSAKRMHDARNLVSLFESSTLPKVKSVRKRFYNNPALFFYLEEAEMVWRVIGDYNLYCDFIESHNVYEVLSDIHMRAGIMEYIADLCKIKNARFFIKNMQYRWRHMLFPAIEYSCANTDVKKAIREGWKKSCNIDQIVRIKPFYSLPMKRPEERIVDCNIDGYDFFWLRNSKDYEIAGKKLKNCLIYWSIDKSPVVCVKKGECYVAAIEISNGMIVQARSFDNSFIENDSNLGLAFEKWQKKYHIKWQAVSDDDFFIWPD